MTEVKLEEKDLLCPGCGEKYITHTQVMVYDRGEDDESTKMILVDEDGSVTEGVVPSVFARNPSQRRHGVALKFLCEVCCGEFELTIAQHKGFTELRWRRAAEW